MPFLQLLAAVLPQNWTATQLESSIIETLGTEITSLRERVAFLEARRDDLQVATNRYLERAREADRQRRGIHWHLDQCQQVAGKALGYPWFKDDQDIFPGATEENGVCIGEHAGETIVEELANIYLTLRNGCKPEQELVIDYTNHRDERRQRHIWPTGRLIYGETHWHPADQWLIEARAEDGKVKLFSIKNIHEVLK